MMGSYVGNQKPALSLKWLTADEIVVSLSLDIDFL